MQSRCLRSVGRNTHRDTYLWRAAGKPKTANRSNPFTDVQEGSYYYDAALWAVENGITNGMSETTFEPDTTCNRGQAVTFLHRSKQLLFR